MASEPPPSSSSVSSEAPAALLRLCEANTAMLVASCVQSPCYPTQMPFPLANQHGEPWYGASAPSDKSVLRLKVYYSNEPGSKLVRWLAIAKFPRAKCHKLLKWLKSTDRLEFDRNLFALDKRPLYEWATTDTPVGPVTASLVNKIDIMRVTTKPFPPISKRDFVDINYEKHIVDANGNITISISSGGRPKELIEYEAKEYSHIFPEEAGIVRGETSGGSGWYISQDIDPETKESADSCTMQYIVHSNINGWMPTVVINNSMAAQFADFFLSVKKAMAKKSPDFLM
jgi:hypothetical protein